MRRNKYNTEQDMSINELIAHSANYDGDPKEIVLCLGHDAEVKQYNIVYDFKVVLNGLPIPAIPAAIGASISSIYGPEEMIEIVQYLHGFRPFMVDADCYQATAQSIVETAIRQYMSWFSDHDPNYAKHEMIWMIVDEMTGRIKHKAEKTEAERLLLACSKGLRQNLERYQDYNGITKKLYNVSLYEFVSNTGRVGIIAEGTASVVAEYLKQKQGIENPSLPQVDAESAFLLKY